MVSLPTGSTTETDIIPPTGMTSPVQLPYPMQTGSGTPDLMPGITNLGQSGEWSWGGQGQMTFRLGENDRNYTLGNKVMGTFWGARNLNRNVSVSLRLAGQNIGNIDGADPAPRREPRGGPDRSSRPPGRHPPRCRRGDQHLHPRRGAIRSTVCRGRDAPFLQNLDGPQLETDWVLIAGAQWAFF